MGSKYSETFPEMEIYRFLKNIMMILTKYISFHRIYQKCNIKSWCQRAPPSHAGAPLEWVGPDMRKRDSWHCLEVLKETFYSLTGNGRFSKHILGSSVFTGVRSAHITREPRRVDNTGLSIKMFVTINKNRYVKQVKTHFPSKEALN